MNKNKTYKLPYILIVIGLMLICFPVLKVHGNSMYPTSSSNDRVLTTGLFYKLSRGDVVIIRGNESYIKRIIGLPGETIEMQEGIVYINGEPYIEDEFAAKNGDTSDYISLSDMKPVTLDEGEYFVLGDNRSASCDSRQWIQQGIHIRRGNISQKVLAYLRRTWI